jgi:hypothetical protein
MSNEKESIEKTAIFDNESLEINVNIYTIEKAKNTFLLNLNSYSKNELIENLKNLLGLIESFLYKYLTKEEINQIKMEIDKENYDFFQLKDAVNSLSAFDNDSAHELAREIAINSYAIFNRVLVKLKIAIPMSKKDFKKKIIESFFDTLNYKDYGFNDFEEFENALLSEYEQKLKELNLYNSRLNFLAFIYSILPRYDLDNLTIVSGFARSGKSTLALQLIKRIYAFRLNKSIKDKELIRFLKREFLAKYTFYIPSYNEFSRRFEYENEKVFLIDEGYFSSDKRESMNKEQINLSKSINAFANKKHITFLIIQFLSDLDLRFINRANILIHCYERGKALIFVKQKSFSFKIDIFGLENYLKRRVNIKDKNVLLYLLKKKAVGILKWKKLTSRIEKIDIEKELKEYVVNESVFFNHKFYDVYLLLKLYYQNLYSQQKEKEQIDKLREFELIEKLKFKLSDGYDFDSLVNELKIKGINEKLAKRLVKKAKEKLEIEKLNVS